MLVAYAIICHGANSGPVTFARKTQPLICAALGAPICADQRNAVSVNQRFLLLYSRIFIRAFLFTHPGFGYCSALCDVVYDEDQLVIVVAVKYLDVDACLGHPARDLAELAGFSLVQSQDEDVAYFQNVDACRFERFASGHPIFEEKVSDALTVDYEGATTFDAHSGAAQRLAHLG